MPVAPVSPVAPVNPIGPTTPVAPVAPVDPMAAVLAIESQAKPFQIQDLLPEVNSCPKYGESGKLIIIKYLVNFYRETLHFDERYDSID
jgi:hypothetical protein